MKNSVQRDNDGCEEPVSRQDHQVNKYQRREEQVKRPVFLPLDQAPALAPLWGTSWSAYDCGSPPMQRGDRSL